MRVEQSKVIARHVPDTSAATLHRAVKATVETGSELFTDTHGGYRGLSASYVHQTVDHSIEYVRGHVHTNGLENFWSLFKRALKATYVSVEPFHLDGYVVEQTFRFNERTLKDGGRFRKVLGAVSGKRITYKELTAHGQSTAA